MKLPTTRLQARTLQSYKLWKKYINSPYLEMIADLFMERGIHMTIFPTIVRHREVMIYLALVYPIPAKPGWGLIDHPLIPIIASHPKKYVETKRKQTKDVPYLMFSNTTNRMILNIEIDKWIKEMKRRSYVKRNRGFTQTGN